MLSATHSEDKSKSPKMSDDEKGQSASTEPPRSTRSSGKASRKTKPSVSSTKFIAETDNFMDYCTRFRTTPLEDNSEPALNIKNTNLDNFWTRVQNSYDMVVETDESDLPEDFKTCAYSKYRSCLITYEDTKAQIGDQLQLLKQMSIPVPTHPTSQPKDESGFGLKVLL